MVEYPELLAELLEGTQTGEPRKSDPATLHDFRLKGLDDDIDLGPYTDAYRAAPEATKAAILDALQRVDDDTPLLYALLGGGTPPLKMPKPAADYQDEPEGDERCANCEFFYVGADGDAICAKVRGRVQGAHWCRLWRGVEPQVSKERTYIDSVAEAPEGVEVREGERGGLYYESAAEPPSDDDDISGWISREDIDVDDLAEFQDTLGENLYNEIDPIAGSKLGKIREVLEEEFDGVFESRYGEAPDAVKDEMRGRVERRAVEEWMNEGASLDYMAVQVGERASTWQGAQRIVGSLARETPDGQFVWRHYRDELMDAVAETMDSRGIDVDF